MKKMGIFGIRNFIIMNLVSFNGVSFDVLKKMDINERVIIRQYFFKTIHSVDGFYIFLTKRKDNLKPFS